MYMEFVTEISLGFHSQGWATSSHLPAFPEDPTVTPISKASNKLNILEFLNLEAMTSQTTVLLNQVTHHMAVM